MVTYADTLTDDVMSPIEETKPVSLTFTVAECGEYHNMGAYHEGIETIWEAIQIYNSIDPSRMNGIPSIGVNLHTEWTESWEDDQIDIMSGDTIDDTRAYIQCKFAGGCREA